MRRYRFPGRKVHFRFTVVVGVLIIVMLMTFSTVSVILSVARQSALSTAETRFEDAGRAAKEKTVSQLQPALDLVTFISYVSGVDSPVEEDGREHPLLALFSRILRDRPNFYSIYAGYPDGTFIQVINAGGNFLITNALEAPEDTRFIIRSISRSNGLRRQYWTFLDSEEKVISRKYDTDFNYDPRLRPWYEISLSYTDAVLSKPYIFSSLQQPGITASHVIPGDTGVIGVDLTISSLSDFVSSQKISPNGGIALLTDNRELIAASPGIEDFLRNQDTASSIPENLFKESSTVLMEQELLRTEIWNSAVNQKLVILSSAPVRDFMGGAAEMRRKIIVISSLILLIIVPVIIFWARKLSRALKDLSIDAKRIGHMDFSGSFSIHSSVYEFHQLAQAFTIMKTTIAARSRSLEETLLKLEMLVDMTIAMSAEFDINRLSEMILSGAKKLTHADGGSLYLVNETRDELEFRIILNDSLGIEQGGSSGNPISMMPVALYDEDGNENHWNVVTHSFHTGRTENIADAYEAGEYDFSGTRKFDKYNNYRSVSFLTVPLKPRGGGDVLGALQLINAIDQETGDIVPFPEELQSVVAALSSAAAVAIQNRNLIERQKRLFDDLVRFVASAIDAKSPYTARHCARVPEIAKLLIRKAEEMETGPFADFSFNEPSDHREFELGALLHDCGKVTTPEYVVDKATKLETIYNRIHEIRTRFEVLLRDARIKQHEAVIAGTDPAEAEKEFLETEQQLHEDFAFIAECNVGSEYMEEDKLERLSKIASISWYRYFDNRIGLSWGEQNRFTNLHDKGQTSLPVQEMLIADRPEHIVPRENWTQESYDKFDFKLVVPEFLYNRGELYNLSINNGTLSLEERFKIEEHVAQTIVMLEHIPFPDDLRRVPEYAGTHHECPNGSGYPRALTASQLSIPAKIIALSDILEALTSTDRPYKKDKMLSEAIEILDQMVRQGLVDRDIFTLLLSSGAYREYAMKFMRPEQVDSVDIHRYLRESGN
jgi:HD-GYP domain-containing protein (c-di-GMP phosphodiesterase class II)